MSDSNTILTHNSDMVVPNDYKYFDAKLNYGLTQKQLQEQKEIAEFRQWILRNPVHAAEELLGSEQTILPLSLGSRRSS